MLMHFCSPFVEPLQLFVAAFATHLVSSLEFIFLDSNIKMIFQHCNLLQDGCGGV
jgi:hypothetical protein